VHKLRNPANITPPLGKYSHGVETAANLRWLYISGQVGVNKDGKTESGIEAQARTAFASISAILADAGMAVADVVKLNVFITDPRFVTEYRKTRDEWSGDVRVASTLLVVAGLAHQDWLIEIEAVAAKA